MHTSGLYDYASDPKFVEYVLTHGRHHWTRAEQVRFAMRHGKPYAPPGEEFHYADTGYVGGTYEAVSTGTTGGAPLPPPPYGTVPPAGSVVPPTTPAGWDDPTRGPGGV